ncbi:MAG: AMP-binding protein [Acidobacteriota bacterium]
MTPDSPLSLKELLLAPPRPDRGLEILDRRGRSIGARSWRELGEIAEAQAGRLHRHGVQPEDRVLLCLPLGFSLLDCWLGSVLRGAWPAAVAPAGVLGGKEQALAQVVHAAEALTPRVIVGSTHLREQLTERGDRAIAERVVTPEELEELTPVTGALPDIHPDQTAFLQLTSGSTGKRRAGVISHRAILHDTYASNLSIGQPLGSTAAESLERMVSWLPMHHDMGLVGGLLFSLRCGFDLTLMAPEAFLARPRAWLQALATGAPSLSPAPNFAYQLCAERVRDEELTGLDLSGWKAALVGAEMVRPETVRGFLERFESCGFSASSLRPCYGLAEATLAVTFDDRGEGPRFRRPPEGSTEGWELEEVTCNGRPVADTELEVRAPDGTVLGEDKVGRLWVKAPSLCDGYYDDPNGTYESFDDGWLDTGDLAFLHDGELYPVGRHKEILVLRGHNVMPHELEWLADEAAGGGGSERCGAFAVARDGSGEEPVLVMEVSGRDDAALRALDSEVRSRLGRALGLPLADLVFVRRGQVPKTSSGKVRRAELRRLYLAQQLDRFELPSEESS